MTIEQEFFEAFGISKIRRCELDDECFMGFGHSCEECDIYGQAYEVYPSITPEIILKLIEILNREYNILIIECMANSTKITACPAPEQDWGCDEAYYRVCVEEKDLRTAILKVCSDYNVAMSIKTQIKALFNEM